MIHDFFRFKSCRCSEPGRKLGSKGQSLPGEFWGGRERGPMLGGVLLTGCCSQTPLGWQTLSVIIVVRWKWW